MPRPEKERIRPGQEADSQKIAATTSLTSIPPRSDVLAELDALAAHVDGAFVVVVKVAGNVKYRRRCYLTAKSAEAAVRRATERGESATVYLAELKPVWRVVA